MPLRLGLKAFALGAAVLGLACPAFGQTVVNDTWLDGTRDDPASPVYSEFGVDSDADGNVESAWYNGGTGATAVASPGSLLLTPVGSSASWTTYFTPEATPLTLAQAGDFVRLRWDFTTGDVNTTNTSQNFRLAAVDTTSGARLVSEGSPGSDTYLGYAMFGNMGETTGHNSSFQLRERNAVNSDLLSSSGNWTGLANGLGNGLVGYADNTDYSFEWVFTRNAADGLDILMTMTGGNIGGTGSVQVAHTDATPSSFTFDTFAIRPSNNTTTATFFDTSLFRVQSNVIPEPTSAAILLAGSAMLGLARRRRA